MYLIIYIFLNICIATFIFIFSFLKLNTNGVKSILGLSLSALLCYGAILQYALLPSNLTETIRFTTTSFGMTFAAITLFTFSLEITYRSRWISPITIMLLAIIPVFTQIIYWLPETIRIFQFSYSLPAILRSFALLDRINILYRYSLLVATIWLLGRVLFLRSGLFNPHFFPMLVGPLIALSTQGLTLLGFQLNGIGELYLASINISAIGFAYITFRHKSNIGLLIRRGVVIENMGDGWIVLDMKNSIIDFNQATAKVLRIPSKNLYGKNITTVFEDFPNIYKTMYKNQVIEWDKTFKVNNDYHYLNIRTSIIKNTASIPIGHLVLWRDITNHKRKEDVRQHAREEMFVLLNAISATASQTTNLEEFLLGTIYQIIYPFRSHMALIYLQDERLNGSVEKEFYLAAHMGLPTSSSKELSRISAISSLFRLFEKNKEPIVLINSNDLHIPEPLHLLQISCWLATPLTIQTTENKKIIGLLFLGRKDNQVYKNDEIIRLAILADHIAALIDSDRRRKLSIALSERQRLMRDIHDSVSQKLYGLVTLTEAAQAAIEANSELNYGQILSRIGENARQAVKELRLFLFQMQPVDLEKEGIVSVLHHRLTAVEGRADIKARFLADEPIELSKTKEVALYFIAQEALNNVLRHAFAKSVSVTLKQGYKYVTLEIKDDGHGFDIDKLDRGGIGLKNIEERVKQENGKLKILSKPGKGTIIRVIFEKDLPNKSGKI